MKIAILLPYKENFSPDYPGAVSIYVKDTTKASKFKNKIFIYGSTNYKKKLLKNYINLPFNKELFQSTSKIYVDNFLREERKRNSDIIEIHNRPSYVNTIFNSNRMIGRFDYGENSNYLSNIPLGLLNLFFVSPL